MNQTPFNIQELKEIFEIDCLSSTKFNIYIYIYICQEFYNLTSWHILVFPTEISKIQISTPLITKLLKKNLYKIYYVKLLSIYW